MFTWFIRVYRGSGIALSSKEGEDEKEKNNLLQNTSLLSEYLKKSLDYVSELKPKPTKRKNSVRNQQETN